MSFRFVHAADLHLDTPFAGIGPVPPELRDALRDASLAAFDSLVDLAITRQAAFVVLAGDTYDGAERGLRAQLRLRAGLERLEAQGIRTFIVPGEHEAPGDWSAIPSWPPGVTVFTGPDVGSVPVERDGTRLAIVHGSGVAGERAPLGFTRDPAEGFHVGVLHGGACRADDLAGQGMDYWALGGGHGREVLAATPWIAVAGTPQGRGFRDPEVGPKGALVVAVEDGAAPAPEFVPLDAVRCLRLDVDVSGISDLTTLTAVLVDRAQELRLQHRGPVLLVRAALTGAGPVHADLLRPGVPDDLLRELRDAERGAASPLWWDGLDDRTRPARDWAELRRRGDLTAELIRLYEQIAADPERLRALGTDRFAPLRRVLPGGDGPADPSELADLLEKAATLAVDLLEGWDRP